MPLPPHGIAGVLPPFHGTTPVNKAARAPFRVSLEDVVERYAVSARRCAILRGLLEYRSELRAVGFFQGYQWLDGSFADTRSVEPNDVDVVTLYSGLDDAALNPLMLARPELFDSQMAKARYRCDAYFVPLDEPAHRIVDWMIYLFGLFSHQRTTLTWRGFVQVPINGGDDDEPAMTLLNEREAQLRGGA